MYRALSYLVFSLGLSAAVANDAATGSPVERIVKLLETMKANSLALGKEEQMIYDKYACWCEKTSKRKAQDIVDAQLDLRSLGQRILKLKGKIATRAAEIAKLTADIEANEEEQESMTALREKQNAAFMAESAEVKQALAALQEAINVLTAATTPAGKADSAGAALIQERQMAQSRYAVSAVLHKLPSSIGFPPARMALLSEFTSAKTGYAPQSATIQGMLSDMYLTFAANLESATQDEADENHNYEQIYATIEKQNNKFKATRERKEEEKAEAEAMLADATKAYEDTEEQMHADMEFFDQTKEACSSKHAEWVVRDKLREQELMGIGVALKILTGDGARELFAKSIKPGVETFLQVGSAPSLLQGSTNAPVFRAYNAIKAQAKKSHSLRLAQLAVQVRNAKFGHFEGVIKAIDEMLKTLAEEGAADLDKKTQCLDEYQNIAQTVNDLDWKIKNNLAKIEKLEGLIELRRKQKADTIQKIEETNQYIDDITKEREEEHNAYLDAKKDDEDAIRVLDAAQVAFAKYYEDNDIKMGPIQGGAKDVLMQADPVFERSADDAPDATFSNKGNNKNPAKNILSLFAYIMEDLADELSNEKQAEEKSQAEFEDERDTALKLVDDLTKKKVNLENIIAKRIQDRTEEDDDMKENNKDRDDELSYQAKIKPDCDWIMKAFDQRATARAAEADGLTQAKEFLAGQVSMLQKKTKFNDNTLSNLGFLALSH